MAMTRSLITRIASNLVSQIQHNHRVLASSSYAYSSALPEASADDTIHLTDSCVRRMKELQASENADKMLRLSVEAGGCSGFQYAFALDDKTNDDDRIFGKDGAKLVVDKISFGFVKGASVDYVEELIRSAFQVSVNPRAVGGCSCKNSFMVKHTGANDLS